MSRIPEELLNEIKIMTPQKCLRRFRKILYCKLKASDLATVTKTIREVYERDIKMIDILIL
jgi:hypothetical protein